MRTRHQSSGTSDDLFEPALYNRAELDFFLTHVGERPSVAAHKGLPSTVNRSAVDDVLGRVYLREEMADAHQEVWCGRQAIRDAIAAYLTWMDTCAEVQRESGLKHPSMFAWNKDGAGIKVAVGSDGGTVRTRIS